MTASSSNTGRKKPISVEEKQGLVARHVTGHTESSVRTVFLLFLLCLIVAGCTLFVHWPVLSAQASSFDDEEAIVQNRLVQNPSWHSLGRFFSEVTLSSVVRGYYRPLTLTSLMLDWAMGGRPDDFRAFHRTSLALHLGSTVLLILLCYQIFRKPWIAATTGLLFGLHPLTVEPIAWVMERKTILAAFFAFACLNAYVRFTWTKGRGWYLAAVALYLMSLLAKPTGTPLPIMMLLMDYWPLARFSRRAVIEKIPFIVLAVVFALLCVVCEDKVNPLSLPAKLSPLHLPLRLCWLIAFYPCKILLPIRLSSVYELPEPLDLTNGLLLLAVATVIASAVALAISRRWTPAFWIGAAIFYVGLSPTMGFVGYSWVSASDKYTYLPAVGPLLALAWLIDRAWKATANRKRMTLRVGLAATVLLAAVLLSLGTRHQIKQWQTTIGFYSYAISIAPDAPYAYYNRGVAYGNAGAYEQAIRDLDKAIELTPGYAEAYDNRGVAYSRKSQPDRAIENFSKAIELRPDYAEAYFNRGGAYGHKGAYEQAIRDYSKAIELRPDYAEAFYSRGNAYAGLGDQERAISDYGKAADLKPDFAEVYNNRGNVYAARRTYDQAIQDYSKAISIKSDYAEAYNNRAVAFYWLKHYDLAWADVRKCKQLAKPPNAGFLKALSEASGRAE